MGASSNSGKVFVFTFSQNYENAEDARVLLVNQSPRQAKVVVSVPGLRPRSTWFSILRPNASTVINLPTEAVPQGTFYDGTGGHAIIVNATEPIYVFGINDAHPRSMDGFTVLPTASLGTEYVVASFTPWTQAQISFVATEDNTLVTITLATEWQHTGIRLNPGENLRFHLRKFQTVHLHGSRDPTGSRIVSDKPISVLTGCRCAFVPRDVHSCDHLVEHLPPFQRWGNSFIATAMLGRLSSTVYRLIAGRINTGVTFNGQSTRTLTLARGDFDQFEIAPGETVFIEATMPCLLVAFAMGYRSDNLTGDPTMTIVPPLNQGVHSAGFVTYDLTRDRSAVQSYLTLLGECFTLENATFNGARLLDQGGLAYGRMDSSRFCTARLPVPYGAHSISADRYYAPFVGYVYGFAPYNSYSFPVAMATNELTCYTDRPDGSKVEHFCDERVVLVPTSVLSGGAVGESICDYSECVYPIHVILIALATAAGAILIEYYVRRKFSQRRKERQKRRQRSMMRAAAAAVSSLTFNRERRPALALTTDVT